MTREAKLANALVRLLVGIGEPCPEGFECEPYDGLYGDAITEATEALNS